MYLYIYCITIVSNVYMFLYIFPFADITTLYPSSRPSFCIFFCIYLCFNKLQDPCKSWVKNIKSYAITQSVPPGKGGKPYGKKSKSFG